MLARQFADLHASYRAAAVVSANSIFLNGSLDSLKCVPPPLVYLRRFLCQQSHFHLRPLPHPHSSHFLIARMLFTELLGDTWGNVVNIITALHCAALVRGHTNRQTGRRAGRQAGRQSQCTQAVCRSLRSLSLLSLLSCVAVASTGLLGDPDLPREHSPGQDAEVPLKSICDPWQALASHPAPALAPAPAPVPLGTCPAPLLLAAVDTPTSFYISDPHSVTT